MASLGSEKSNASSIDHQTIGLSVNSSSTLEVSIESYDDDYEEDSPKMKLYKKGLYDPGDGEVCAVYITMSSSTVREHPYYNYPSVLDPGIIQALQQPEKEKVYDESGQDLYLDLCKSFGIIPMRLFHRSLVNKMIDMRYYGINPSSMKPMCMALAYNQTVKRLDLTGNYLDHVDASYHLGQMLGDRNVLQSLILNGCKIGPKGVHQLVVYLKTRKMFLLDLTGNNILDLGFSYLANVIEQGAVIKHLSVSRNDLTSQSALILAEAIAFNDSITHLDFSWNKFFKVRGPTALCRRLGHSKVLESLNFSWTGLPVVAELRNLLSIQKLRVLDISNNSLSSQAATTIAKGLHLAKKLQILDLSGNSFTPADALLILSKMKRKAVNLQDLRMEHIVVSKEFAEVLKEVMNLDFRGKTKITHGHVLLNYTIPLHDLRTITLTRFVMTTKKKHGNKLDILAYLLELYKTQHSIDPSDLIATIKMYDIKVNEDIIDGLVKLFAGPKNEKGLRTINLMTLLDYARRLWPDKKAQPAPTPPTSPKKGKKNKK